MSSSSVFRRPRRRISLAVLVAVAWMLAYVGVAAASAPQIAGTITDQVHALDACLQEVQSAQRTLEDRTGSVLYLVFVDSTDGQDMSAYVNDIIDRSNGQVTEQDALLAVATGDRQFQLYTGSSLKDRIGATEQDSLTETYIVPALKTSDWCAAATGATIAVSSGLGVSNGPGPDVPPVTNQPPSTASSGGGIPSWLWLLVIVAIVGGIAFWFLRGRANHAVYQERATQEDLGKQASSLLIATDDALRSADQELGFAQAQFGDAQAAPFGTALEAAKAELRQAFTISQQLDDDKPETPDQRRAMLQEIIDRCTRAKAMVDAQMARIKQLRDLSKNVDEVLPQTSAAADAQVARVEPARSVLKTLAARFAAENIAAVAGNPEAADAKLTTAKASLAAAVTALGANQRDDAVSKVQEAEAAIGEASAALDAVDATQQSLAQSETQLGASIAAVQQDITQARAALSAGKSPERAADVERAAQILGQAQTMAAATPLDVVGATRAATEANSVIDGVLAGIQAADAATQRNAAAAQAALTNASASVAQANALVAANGATAAGRQARTRVAEAQQYLARAQSLMATDPATAAQAAQTADALADEAIADIQASGAGSGSTWSDPSMGYGGGAGRGYGQPSGGGGGLESFLGGLLGGMLSGGGGGRNSGWSGGSGGFGGFGSGGFGGGGSHSGGGGGRSSGGGGGGHSGRRSGGGF